MGTNGDVFGSAVWRVSGGASAGFERSSRRVSRGGAEAQRRDIGIGERREAELGTGRWRPLGDALACGVAWHGESG